MNCGKWIRASFLLMLALTLAIPAMAQIVANSEAPGSVLVFPKFIKGTVPFNGGTAPKSEIEISVRCPPELDAAGVGCAERLRVKLKAHWVCPSDQSFESKYICKETDFDLFTTVNGTITLNANGGVSPASAGRVPTPPCNRGYLIVWVVGISTGSTFPDQPISFNGLIGDAVLREMGGASAYNAIPIQAIQAPGLAVALGAGGSLAFTGVAAQYAALPSRIFGSVQFDKLTGSLPLAQTSLTLLTLDVRSNRSNNPTFVDLNFFNENEELVSTSTEFICWTQVPLSDIDGNLTQAGMGSRKGLVASDFFAVKIPFGGSLDPVVGAVPVLGIVETAEFDGIIREWSYSLFNSGGILPLPALFTPSSPTPPAP
jgi:hypothetical protein